MSEPEKNVPTAEAKTDPAPAAPPAPYVPTLRDRYLGLAPIVVAGPSRAPKKRR